MAVLSEVTFEVKDGALGIVPSTQAQTQVKLGVSTGGTPNVLYSAAGLDALETAIGKGPLAEAAGAVLNNAGGPVLVMPVNPSQFGYAGAVTKVGTGAGTLAISIAPHRQVYIKITTGGTLGNGQFTWRVGTGPTSSPVTLPGGGTFRVPGTFCVVTFPAGTYVLNEDYTIATTGVITRTGATGPAITQQSSPVDQYEVKVKIITAGGLGTMQFQYALDDHDVTDDTEDTFSAVVTSPGGGVYVVPDTGLVFTFASTFVAGDYYWFLATPPGYNSTDVNDAMNALHTTYLTIKWGVGHLVGEATSAAGAISMASTVDTQMSTFFTKFRFVRFLVECPTVNSVITSGSAAIYDTADNDAALVSASASFNSTRVGVCAGNCDYVSTITGRKQRRNAAWPIAARLAAITPGEDAAWVGRGKLVGVTRLFRDESATPLLDAARFNTLRTIVDAPGFYVSGTAKGAGLKTMSTTTSDFYRFANCRVMDMACQIAREKLVPYIQGNVLVDAATGFIVEESAVAIETIVNGALKDGVVNTRPPNASASSVRIVRDANILSTQVMPVDVRVTPLGYLGEISVRIGFTNPALQAAAA